MSKQSTQTISVDTWVNGFRYIGKEDENLFYHRTINSIRYTIPRQLDPLEAFIYQFKSNLHLIIVKGRNNQWCVNELFFLINPNSSFSIQDYKPSLLGSIPFTNQYCQIGCKLYEHGEYEYFNSPELLYEHVEQLLGKSLSLYIFPAQPKLRKKLRELGEELSTNISSIHTNSYFYQYHRLFEDSSESVGGPFVIESVQRANDRLVIIPPLVIKAEVTDDYDAPDFYEFDFNPSKIFNRDLGECLENSDSIGYMIFWVEQVISILWDTKELPKNEDVFPENKIEGLAEELLNRITRVKLQAKDVFPYPW